MEKRDRIIKILYHRKTGTVLLFPYVCYMAGMGAGFGDAASLSGENEALIGEHVSKMLSKCRKANVEPLAKRRSEALNRKWRGEDVPGDELHPEFGQQSNWKEVLSQFPAICKGPGTYHRSFAVAEIIERDPWKSWKLVRAIRSEHAGCEAEGETVRILRSTSTSELGRLIMEPLRSW